MADMCIPPTNMAATRAALNAADMSQSNKTCRDVEDDEPGQEKVP